MVKPSAPIKASSTASSLVFKCHSNALQDAGQKKSQQYYGGSALLSTGRLDILLSSWFTAQKQSCHPTSSTILRESSNMPKKKTSTLFKTASTCSTKNAPQLALVQLSTSKGSAATIAAESAVAPSRRATWFYDSS